MRTRILTIRKVKAALEVSSGMPTQAAKKIGVSYQAIWKFLKKNPELKEFQNAARAKLHEETENMIVFAIKTGYVQKSVLDENGIPTKEIAYEEVDYRTRLSQANFLMSQYKGSVGIKEEIDITTNGKDLPANQISVIELPEALRPKNTQQSDIQAIEK